MPPPPNFDQSHVPARAVCIGAAALIFGSALVGFYFLFAPNPRGMLPLLLIPVFQFIVFGVSNAITVGIYNRVSWRQQAEIDQAAHETIRSKGTFFLYLRSFAFEDNVRVFDDNDATLKYTCFRNAARAPVQFYVATALRGVAPTLGIGGRPSAGITKLTTDDEHWREEFEALARDSAGIFVLPSLTEGSQWELFWLLDNALEKTMVIVPPANAVRGVGAIFWHHYNEFIVTLVGRAPLLDSKAFKSPEGSLYQLTRAAGTPPYAFARRHWVFSPKGLGEAAQHLLTRGEASGVAAPQASDEEGNGEEGKTGKANFAWLAAVLGVVLVAGAAISLIQHGFHFHLSPGCARLAELYQAVATPAIDAIQWPIRQLRGWLHKDLAIAPWVKDLHVLSFGLASLHFYGWLPWNRVPGISGYPARTLGRIVSSFVLGFTGLAFLAWLSALASAPRILLRDGTAEEDAAKLRFLADRSSSWRPFPEMEELALRPRLRALFGIAGIAMAAVAVFFAANAIAMLVAAR